MAKSFVSIVMGSDSDMEVMKEAVGALDLLGVPHEVRVISAHRSPSLLPPYVRESEKRGAAVFIAGAGAAAALPGAVAALTTKPVLGVPIASSSLHGLDALLAMAQMPGGIPVGTLAIGAAGARNAGLLAAQVLALSDRRLAAALRRMRADMARGVAKKDAALRRRGK